MAVLELDLTDKANPPADDPVKAPHGWMWDRPAKRWRPRKKMPTGGWMSRRAAPKSANFADFPSSQKTATLPESDPMFPFERDVAGDDPPPAYATTRPPKLPRTPPKVTAKTKGDMSAAVGLVGMLVLPPIVKADPFCGQALTDSFQGIADALVPLLCRSERVVAFFTEEASDWMLWFKLAVAVAPVAVAFGQHHLLKTVKVVQDTDEDGKPTGDLYAVSTQPANLEEAYPA